MSIGEKVSWTNRNQEWHGRIVALTEHSVTVVNLPHGGLGNVPLGKLRKRTRYVSGDLEWEQTVLPLLQ
jgi:hypothetical protein